jgi:hypothetical protein
MVALVLLRSMVSLQTNCMRGILCWEVVDQIVQRRCGYETTSALVFRPSHNVKTRCTL